MSTQGGVNLAQSDPYPAGFQSELHQQTGHRFWETFALREDEYLIHDVVNFPLRRDGVEST